MQKTFIPIILGTNRQDNQSQKAANFILQKAQELGQFDTEIIDLKNIHLPHNDYGPAIKPQFPELQQTMEKADGFIFVVPEYNHSYPGILKSVMDIFKDEYHRKPAAIASVSVGDFAGVRMIEHFISLLFNFGMLISPQSLLFSNIKEVFNEFGELQNEKYTARTEKFLNEIDWLTKSLQQAKK